MTTRRPSPGLHALLAACGGFLVSTVWFDLMFDVQVRGYPGAAPLPETVVASIAGYYRRVTTDAHPMNLLVGLVMAVAVLGTTWQLRYAGYRAARWAAVVTAVTPITLAAIRVVPDAVRLGARAGSLADDGALARTIFADHALCLALIAIFTVIQVTLARAAASDRT